MTSVDEVFGTRKDGDHRALAYIAGRLERPDGQYVVYYLENYGDTTRHVSLTLSN